MKPASITVLVTVVLIILVLFLLVNLTQKNRSMEEYQTRCWRNPFTGKMEYQIKENNWWKPGPAFNNPC